jgi:magnesium-transporting ATPase (P-type)
LIPVKNLLVEETALTGESLPVAKRSAAVLPDSPLGDRFHNDMPLLRHRQFLYQNS